ncbi:hypothetical protein HPB47_004965 [Ixodes persulcatus]|uniref:Uncharacterized protein n=1 Tax=Ixodes persulcatus TaxID=34615 RepID=A0AC60PEK3_IXOPE|nr:hypothetical protein HPB47_004965 [Ixodes persulcatus]
MNERNGLPPATKGTFAAADDDVVVTLDDIERLANASLKPEYFVYFNGGAGQDQTLRENMSAFMRLRLRPRVLMGVAVRSTEVTLLGDQKLSLPVGISPTAAQSGAHPDGEVATAKAAQNARTVMVVSTFSATSIEDLRSAAPDGLRWFQLSIYKDRDFTRKSIEELPSKGGPSIRATLCNESLLLPGVWVFPLVYDVMVINVIGSVLGASGIPRAETWNGLYRDVLDASATWDDVAWLKSISKLPIEALPEVVRAVRGRVEVYLDGGVRRGTDVVKALALGAKAVFVGRPVLWGLAYNGQAGVSRMLEILREELDRALALMGCTSVDQLRPEMVVHQQYYSDLLKRPQMHL